MPSERVLDASVYVAAIYREDASLAAQARLLVPGRFIAPDLIFAELTHVGAKKMRRGEASAEQAATALERLSLLLAEVEACRHHAQSAVRLAAALGITGYDAMYVALAEVREVPLLTADGKLAERMRGAGMGAMVDLLEP